MRFLTGTVAIATVLATTGIVVGPAAGAAEPPPVCAAEQSGEAQAAAMAHACGQRVEVLAKRTEYAQVFANPSGTFTIEQHAAPVRVRTRSGSWTPIDTRLRKLPDGSLAPAATLADVRFSGGGNAAAVSLSNSRGRLELNWPATLPVPRIDGDSAVYPEVLPGVDLRVQALASGFTHVLVVRTREAAADPALRRIRYSLASPGLASRPAGDGFELVDSSGTAVVRGGAPLMWDSRGDDSGPAASTARAPGDQARTVRARLSIPAAADKRDVVIEPDADLLADPAAVLPIYIDPYYETAWHHWTFANSTNTSNDRVTQRVGRSPDNGALYRTFIEFPTATLHGKHVLSARFYAKLVHSWSCASTPVSLYWTASVPMADRVGWSPGLWRHLDERSAHAHKGSADCGNQPDVNMEFAGGLAGLLQEAANGYWGPITLGLAARRADGSAESTTSYWKKFDPGAPRMTAEYNSYPNTPTDRTIDNQACATGDGRAVVGIPTPTMRARATDPDGAAGGQLGVIFTWDRWDAGTGTWTGQGWIEVGNIPHDSVAQLMIPAGYLANGGRYRWHTYAHDGVFDNSPWSDWCEFDVDTAGPTVAPTVTSPVYRDDLVNFYGAVGKTANFTLGANGIGDVAGYKWGWVSPPITQVAAASLGASVTLPLTPPPPNPATPTLGGLATLYVTSYDRTGRPSPERRYTFLLGSATNPAGRWDLAEPAGATNLADSSGAGRAATLLGGATGQPSRFQALAGLPTALTLDGIDDFAGVPGPTVDTSTSFTVSAWVRPETADDGFRTIVGVGGTRTSPFTLSRTGDRWIFWLNKTDDDVPVAGAAVAATFSRPGVWSHVVGVYDAGARQVQIYVDGRLEASEQQVWAPFRSTGATEIGRGIWTGVFDPTWHGGIAEVRLWDRVLSAGEVAAMAATLTANWGLDGDGFDSAAVPHDLTDPGTLTWTRDRRGVDAAAVSLNGIDQALTVVAGPVRTEQSFTATAWVNLRAVPTGPKAAVSMDDGVNHSFFLGFRLNAGNPCWNFVTHDGAGHSLHIFAPLTPSTDAGDWVHLAGVFDAQAGLMRLYVNGVLTATGPKVSNGPPTGTARTTVGETRWGGLLTDRWPGAIDDVRLYQGALPATEIAKLAVS